MHFQCISSFPFTGLAVSLPRHYFNSEGIKVLRAKLAGSYMQKRGDLKTKRAKIDLPKVVIYSSFRNDE